MRIDADYFRPDYLEVQEQMERRGSRPLQDFRVEIRHPREINRSYVDAGTLFLRAQNVRPMAVDLTSNPVYVSDEDAEKLSENVLEYKDILITRTGANFGQCAIYLEDSKAIASSHTFIVKSGDLNPFYLTVYLNTKYGRALIDKGRYGGLQPEIAPPFLRQILVPVWDDIPLAIEKAYLRSQELIQQAKAAYAAAQATLLSELGLADWRPRLQSTFVRNFADLGQAGRMDSDYFQPKYGEIVDAIKGYAGGWATLGELVRLKDQNYLPESGREYQYIELANIGHSGEVTGSMSELGQDLPSRARRQVAAGDVIVSSIEGSLESIALIDHEYDQSLCSTGFHVVNPKMLNSETLLALLKSPVGQMQLKKGCSGTILSAINRGEFSQIVLPLIAPESQGEIREQVAEAAALRRQSRRLLELAKGAVELAIERDEAAALGWLAGEVGDLVTLGGC